MKSDKKLIRLVNVSKIYKVGSVEVPALKNVSLTIKHGESLAVMGPSGSGKSTLMNLLGCLDRPTSGTYFFEDDNVGLLSDDRLAAIRNQKIGFVFQNYNLLSRSSALANVGLPQLYGGGRDPALVKNLLKEVGLGDRMDHIPTQLSGGQQQRVAIARALVNSPPRHPGRRAHGESGQKIRRRDSENFPRTLPKRDGVCPD